VWSQRTERENIPPNHRIGSRTFSHAARSRIGRPDDANLDDLHSGVILYTKRKPQILPKVRRTRDARTVPKTLLSAMSIFSGEYWFFTWPSRRPPKSSLREPGDPTTLDMTVQQFGSLTMQARQEIATPQDMSCCRSIDVVVSGAEERPETVLIELVLADNDGGKFSEETLGAQSLASPRFISGQSAGDRKSTYTFAMPSHATVRSFNELVVWFHLLEPRSRQSARVAIDRFDLVP
jgi:hypothetical protein